MIWLYLIIIYTRVRVANAWPQVPTGTVAA